MKSTDVWYSNHELQETWLYDKIVGRVTTAMAAKWPAHELMNDDIDGLVQESRSFSALAMELRLSCINPSIWSYEQKPLDQSESNTNVT